MKPHVVIPNKGIGNIQLGMSKLEIDSMFDKKSIDEELGSDEELLSVRYNSRFEVLYDSNNIAVEISAIIIYFDDEPLMLYDMDLLKTRAEDIILTMSNYASFTYDEGDKDLSTTYFFKDLGITLWRGIGFHSKLLNDAEFLSMSLESQEYEKQFLFFEAISIK